MLRISSTTFNHRDLHKQRNMLFFLSLINTSHKKFVLWTS
ncbi:hypothetical protein P879_11515 [Paragonimus westermani]|uniref:Uncharacterized protein n=1 Tax=Paragonimus westermani TaxID=34504 RepID=A0A8T0D5H5_9TREM|nr:hypothetical protein P879_11515 [Paragonimus westermani]